MRSSSLKTVIATVTISVALVAVAPSADARTQPARKPSAVREVSPADRAFRLAQRFVRRVFGGRVWTNGDSPSVPIPGGAAAPEVETFIPMPPGTDRD